MDNNKKKVLTKSDIAVGDAVYIIFSIVAAFCFLAIAVVAAFVFACCCKFLFASFSLGSGKVIAALGLTLIGFLCVALFVYVNIIVFNVVKNGIKKYLNERKEALNK